MREFSAVIDIEAEPRRVCEVLFDVPKWPAWTPTIDSARQIDPGPMQVGSRFDVRQPKLRPATWRVTNVDPSGGFDWTAAMPGLVMDGLHRVEAMDNGARSRVTLAFVLSGLLSAPAALVYGKLIASYVATEAAALKRRCES